MTCPRRTGKDEYLNFQAVPRSCGILENQNLRAHRKTCRGSLLTSLRSRLFIKQNVQKTAHAGSRTRVTSMGGLYDAATLRALVINA